MNSDDIQPRDDARFSILRADAETNWRTWNLKMVERLEQQGHLQSRLDNAAERAVEILQRAEKTNVPMDCVQELINEILFPPAEETPEDEEFERQPW